MSKYRHIQHLIILLLMTFLLTSHLCAETPGALADLYRSNNIERLHMLDQQKSITQRDWRLFVEALFLEDAELATQQMMHAYSLSTDNALKRFIRERISQFYVARGYYETARRILNETSFFNKMVSISEKRSQQKETVVKTNSRSHSNSSQKGTHFGVQVGAFSTLANAKHASKKYRKNYANTLILEKEKNSLTLYVIVIGSYQTRKEAEREMPKINNRFNLKGYVIQY